MKIKVFIYHIKSLIIKKKGLRAKFLTLPNAMRLASILSSKIDLDKIDPQSNAIDFIGDLIDRLSPKEYIETVVLLTGENEKTVRSHASIEVLTSMIEGLKKNQVITLIGFYRSLNL